jgi:hypothetical protein
MRRNQASSRKGAPQKGPNRRATWAREQRWLSLAVNDLQRSELFLKDQESFLRINCRSQNEMGQEPGRDKVSGTPPSPTKVGEGMTDRKDICITSAEDLGEPFLKVGKGDQKAEQLAFAGRFVSAAYAPSLQQCVSLHEALIIRDATQLRALKSVKTVLSTSTLRLDLPGFSADAARLAVERIISYRNECGCSLGAKCMVGGFGLGVTWLGLNYGVFTTHFLWRLPWAVLCAFAAAGLGKVFGIVRARDRLNEEIDKLISLQSNAPKEKG